MEPITTSGIQLVLRELRGKDELKFHQLNQESTALIMRSVSIGCHV